MRTIESKQQRGITSAPMPAIEPTTHKIPPASSQMAYGLNLGIDKADRVACSIGLHLP
jgi:hypothetical protein